jgi:soluble lytic murein transglycosylase-like protein
MVPQPVPEVSQIGPKPAPPDPAWSLKGGQISGGFLDVKAKALWPLWMQALLDGREGVDAQELKSADLYKVPDVFLCQAIQTLVNRGIFNPKLLRQATAIQYTAQTSEWVDARSSYQIAYLSARGLPVQDPLTTSRMLSQLTRRGNYALVRDLLERTHYPATDAALNAAFLRMVDVEESPKRPARERVLDPALPPIERLHVLVNLKHPGDIAPLLSAFKDTDCLDLAVFYALSKNWIETSSPFLDEAIRMKKKPNEASPWLMIRPEERVSDLLWTRAMEAAKKDDKKTAIAHARTILQEYGGSWFAGHATYLLGALDPSFKSPPKPALRVPGDLTCFNAGRLATDFTALDAEWPEAYRDIAAHGRYDLILAAADSTKETNLFLRAAHLAGQQDLVARYLASERGCTPFNAQYLYPVHLAPLAERLLKEEKLEGQVDAAFVLAMIKNESVFQPAARSGAEAFGIMQLLKPTFSHMADPGDDIMDAEKNIRAGIRYYRTVIDTAQLRGLPMETRLCYVLAGYHAGEGRAKRWREANESTLGGRTAPLAMLQRIDAVPITSTRQYVSRGMGDWKVYRRILDKGQKG